MSKQQRRKDAQLWNVGLLFLCFNQDDVLAETTNAGTRGLRIYLEVDTIPLKYRELVDASQARMRFVKSKGAFISHSEILYDRCENSIMYIPVYAHGINTQTKRDLTGMVGNQVLIFKALKNILIEDNQND